MREKSIAGQKNTRNLVIEISERQRDRDTKRERERERERECVCVCVLCRIYMIQWSSRGKSVLRTA